MYKIVVCRPQLSTVQPILMHVIHVVKKKNYYRLVGYIFVLRSLAGPLTKRLENKRPVDLI